MQSNILIAALGVLLLGACGGQPTASAQSLFATELAAQRGLPDRLVEVSGLAVAPDGRLFAHDDEIGMIYEINAATGESVNWFLVGEEIVTGDFEGLTITPDGTFWLTNSDGKLYRFREGQARHNTPYEDFSTGLKRVCEVEGVAYLASAESLILACKRYYGRDMEDAPAFRLWPITGGETTPWGPSARALAAAAGVRRFQPSDVTIDPATGRVIVISGNDGALAEISPDGEVLTARTLGRGHPQAEGVAVAADGSLLIADEGGTDQAQLTRYARAQ